MERKNRSTIITIRIPDGLLEKIEKDIEKSGDFTSRADYILVAIRNLQNNREKMLEEKKILENQQEDDFVVSPKTSIQDNLI